MIKVGVTKEGINTTQMGTRVYYVGSKDITTKNKERERKLKKES